MGAKKSKVDVRHNDSGILVRRIFRNNKVRPYTGGLFRKMMYVEA